MNDKSNTSIKKLAKKVNHFLNICCEIIAMANHIDRSSYLGKQFIPTSMGTY